MEKLVLPCECAGTCSILLVWELEKWGSEPQSFYLDFYTQVDGRASFKERFKQACRLLFQKKHNLDGMVLFEEGATELRDFLARTLEEPNAPPLPLPRTF